MKNDGLGNINKKLNKAPEEVKEIKPIQTIDNEGLGSIELPRYNIIASKNNQRKNGKHLVDQEDKNLHHH